MGAFGSVVSSGVLLVVRVSVFGGLANDAGGEPLMSVKVPLFDA